MRTVTDIRARMQDDGTLEVDATVDGEPRRYVSPDEGETWTPGAIATITSDLGLKVEATIAVDGVEVGPVTLTRMAEGGLPLATGSTWASSKVATWVAGQPDSRRAIWTIEQAVAEALESLLVVS